MIVFVKLLIYASFFGCFLSRISTIWFDVKDPTDMTNGIFILDFDRQNFLQASSPDTIARSGKTWKQAMNRLEPWEKIPAPFVGVSKEEMVWHTNHSAGKGPAVLVCGSCTSTMDVAWHFIENRQMHAWDSVVAVRQTTGRGQQKREWLSPAGNLHVSWLLPLPEVDPEQALKWDGLLSLMTGFVLVRAFNEMNVPAKMKWPNDLLMDNRKFAGILVERRGPHILAGIGINVAHFPDDRRMREDAAVPATSLAAQGIDTAPLDLWLTLAKNGKKLFESLILALTPLEFVRLADRQMAWMGEKVLIRQTHADVFEAVILGMAEDGGLRIKKDKEAVIYSGSLLPLTGC